MRAFVVRARKVGLPLIDEKASVVIQRINTVPSELKCGCIYQGLHYRAQRASGCNRPVEVMVFHAADHGSDGAALGRQYGPLDLGILFKIKENFTRVDINFTNAYKNRVTDLELFEKTGEIVFFRFGPSLFLPFNQ